MLRGSLKTLALNPDALLDAAGIAGTARAEELDLAQFCALARAYRRFESAKR
jgi:16S rRNA (adenine1518-N6/adenine1519-N6)-dimethyltransferase